MCTWNQPLSLVGFGFWLVSVSGQQKSSPCYSTPTMLSNSSLPLLRTLTHSQKKVMMGVLRLPSITHRIFTSSRHHFTSKSPLKPPKLEPVLEPKLSPWQWWLSEKVMPPRFSLPWVGEMILVCTVFGITGTSTMMFVRPAVGDILQLKGSLKEG